MKYWLSWFIPPLAGAVIGYITNVVAIRMLFRPLNAIRVFGIRLPFTPGILPRQRHQLAESIGRMVERELLTPEIIRERLAQEDVCLKAAARIAEYTEKTTIRDLEGIIVTYLSSRAEHIGALLVPAAKKSFPQAADRVIRFLKRNDIHTELEIQGRIFLSSALLKFSVFQRFFISAGQYDRTLSDKMPEIIDDLINQLEELFRDNTIRDRLIALGADALKSALAGENSAGALARFISSIVPIHADMKVKEILEPLGLGDPVILADKLLLIASDQVEAALASINVRTLVSDRIDSLDMLKVEGIVLDVMANQLKWIDVFGAILGFGIGVFQAVLGWALR
ncbi:hypothetical protein FACS1894140_4390 [Spirochaetia bacterium]|nr:hypothetical protein FACS1894140_4390 [Spirochaetia bacterium]